MPREGEYACPYCQIRVATLRGVHSHIMQNKKCRARMNSANSDPDEPDCELSPELPATIEDMRDDNSLQMDVDLWEDDDVPMGVDPPVRAADSARAASQSPRRTTVEDESEEPAVDNDTYIEAYPRPAGTAHGQGESSFETYRRVQAEDGQSPWSPFESAEEWELAQWLMGSGVSQTKVDDFLKLRKVSNCSALTRHAYQNSNQNLIDSRWCQPSLP